MLPAAKDMMTCAQRLRKSGRVGLGSGLPSSVGDAGAAGEGCGAGARSQHSRRSWRDSIGGLSVALLPDPLKNTAALWCIPRVTAARMHA